MIFFKCGFLLKLSELSDFNNIDFYWETPDLSFIQKVSSFVREKYKIPVNFLNLEFYKFLTPLEESFFIFTFPNIRLALKKKADFLPTLGIQPVWETVINMPLEVLYPNFKADTEGAYTFSIEGNLIKLPEISVLSLLYELYDIGKSNQFYLKILDSLNNGKDVWFLVEKVSSKFLRLKKIDEVREELPLIDKGWLKFLDGEREIRFFGKILQGKFKVKKQEDTFLLKRAKQPSTSWEINEPFAPLPYSFPISFSHDSDLYIKSWPFQWARYPGDNLETIIWEILTTLDKIKIEEGESEEDYEKIDDVELFLDKLEKEGSILREVHRSLFKKISYFSFFNYFLQEYFLNKRNFKKTINRILKRAEKDMTRMTDEDKEAFYNEVETICNEFTDKGLQGEDLKGEVFKILKSRFPYLKDRTIFFALEKVLAKKANVYTDKEQPIILPDDYGVSVFPHHDFPGSSSDVANNKNVYLDQLNPIDYALPTGGSYLISLPQGDQFLIDDLKEFLFRKKRKRAEKKAQDEFKELVKDFIEMLENQLIREEVFIPEIKKMKEITYLLFNELKNRSSFSLGDCVFYTKVTLPDNWEIEENKLHKKAKGYLYLILYETKYLVKEFDIDLYYSIDKTFKYEIKDFSDIEVFFSEVEKVISNLIVFLRGRKEITFEEKRVEEKMNELTGKNFSFYFSLNGFKQIFYVSAASLRSSVWKEYFKSFLEKSFSNLKVSSELVSNLRNIFLYEELKKKGSVLISVNKFKEIFPEIYEEFYKKGTSIIEHELKVGENIIPIKLIMSLKGIYIKLFGKE